MEVTIQQKTQILLLLYNSAFSKQERQDRAKEIKALDYKQAEAMIEELKATVKLRRSEPIETTLARANSQSTTNAA